MKNTLRNLFAGLMLCLMAVSAQANVKQVTNVSGTVSTVLTPSKYCRFAIIQNNGTGNVRLTFDGGSTFTDPNTSGGTTTGTDPTATTGYRLAAGKYVIITYTSMNSQGADTANHVPIRAILETATTTTLDFVTDDTKSS